MANSITVEDLDVEVLLTLVEERPVLWDKSLEEYKSKTETTGAWREIFVRINPNFEKLSDKEKNQFGKEVIKKWTNIRDRHDKYLKSLKEETKTGSKAKTVKKYVYSDQLSFLKNNAKPYPSESSLDTVEKAAEEDGGPDTSIASVEDNQFSFPPSKKKPKQKYTDVEKTILAKLEAKEDRHLSFFKGLLPSLHLLSNEETVRFQIGVLNVLQHIQMSKHSQHTFTQLQHNRQFNQPTPVYYPASQPHFAYQLPAVPSYQPTPSPSHQLPPAQSNQSAPYLQKPTTNDNAFHELQRPGPSFGSTDSSVIFSPQSVSNDSTQHSDISDMIFD